MGKKHELAGKTFGRLTVLKEVDRSKDGNVLWKCRCSCGNETVVQARSLVNGSTVSCGCYRKEQARKACTKHGFTHHSLYRRWSNIRSRCFNPKAPGYENYGGRGITMHQDWVNDPEAFCKYCLNHGWREGLEIDRIDIDGNYEPGNIQFVTRNENKSKRRSRGGIPFVGVTWDRYSRHLRISLRSNGTTYMDISANYDNLMSRLLERDLIIATLGLPNTPNVLKLGGKNDFR